MKRAEKKLTKKAKANKPAKVETVLVMRTSNAKLQSYNNFQWPQSGPVECPDWKPTPACGNGLHGLLWGEGNAEYLSTDADAKWQIVEVAKDSIVDICRKVKFPRGVVVHTGTCDTAIAYLLANGGAEKSICYGTATAGYGGTATAGDRGTATAGDRGTATAGYGGTAMAGDRGTATAGYGGTATAGYGGTAMAGDRGILQIKYYDPAADRYRVVTGYVGEGGINKGDKYQVIDAKLVKVIS